MALTAAEEAQTRELLAQQAAILSLADSEAAIISNLGATDVSLSDLSAASSIGDADLFLIRQGSTDKSISGALVKSQPNASETSKGIIELATIVEARVGTDSERAITPYSLFSVSLAIGQTWQNVTGSRAFNTTYTNTTGKPISVSVFGNMALASTGLTGVVNGSPISSSSVAEGNTAGINFIVPIGGTYYVSNGSTVSLASWNELKS